MNARLSSTLILTLVVAVLAGCGKREHYGAAIGTTEPTKIATILATPNAFADSILTVTGTIVTECPSGCWFEVRQDRGVLYVDLGRQGLAIPPRVGREVTVEGRVTIDGKTIRLAGEGVEIR